MILYNDIDPYICAWLRNLCEAGQLAAGPVWCRDIAQIEPAELAGFKRLHFFAGIGGWELALKLAGWPEEEEIWSGSCPCPSLSGANSGRRGEQDSRHLWPAFFRLIDQRRPRHVCGEQVASGDGLEWLAGIHLDLEHIGYRVCAADLPAACVGAPIIRQRLFWFAERVGGTAEPGSQGSPQRGTSGKEGGNRQGSRNGSAGSGQASQGLAGAGYHDGTAWRARGQLESKTSIGEQPGGDSSEAGLAGTGGLRWGTGRSARPREAPGGQSFGQPSGCGANGVLPWNGPTLEAQCTDGYRRIPAQSGLFPLVDGLQRGLGGSRAGILKGAGNAIVPQAAARFIEAVMDVLGIEPKAKIATSGI